MREQFEAADPRYQGNGDLDLTKAERGFLRAAGYEPWGKGGWIRDDENGDTCYDNKWAMQDAFSRIP